MDSIYGIVIDLVKDFIVNTGKEPDTLLIRMDQYEDLREELGAINPTNDTFPRDLITLNFPCARKVGDICG